MDFSNSSIFGALCSFLLIQSTFALVTTRSENVSLQARWNPICWSILVSSWDTCESLTAKCGVSSEDFATFNPAVSCSALPFGKPVCCSAGTQTLPPKGQEPWCYDYTARDGHTCEEIAQGYKISVTEIESFNKDTWGWQGCGAIQEGSRMCISPGEPPMPVALANAVCGPQVPGTVRPKDWSQLSSVNPCPAGQCCSGNGQCGTGAEFCGSSKPEGEKVTTKGAPIALTRATTLKTTEKASVTSVVSAATTSHQSDKREINLLDIPLTYYHPEEDVAPTATTSTSSKTTSSASKTGSIETVEYGWQLQMWPGTGCKGSNYMLLKGYNKKLEDSDCLVLPGWDIPDVFDGKSVSCQWWSDGGLTSAPCNTTKLMTPGSWIISNGLCTVSPNEVCDNYNDLSQTYGARWGGTCQNRKSTDPSPFGSMKCYVG
ncbi:unnamed protein product [Penicillium salamii]|uniref:LysM domain-containing protein n=1 Tax=Penicillium salamii TaxID=1612424 RepID=A0A9W4J742_9EURO|nr:unnamed protein product [Penicillium salamii]CAG8064887.1 unnamed protein product [Penicillium salamii]CAG8072066.1 unnamed protein product [Penicillium salamii]CAG8171862.1 unnamed protein product [Penicillium salamii]CAG8228990.1 unnamed protein product [Penicillium salamii]